MRPSLSKKLETLKTTAADGLRPSASAGFTLIEVILVIALMAVIFIVVVPNFNIVPSSEASSKINGLAGDIRAAYDMSVLHRKPYRLVFEFKTADYWLESTERLDFRLGDDRMQHDLSPTEAKDAAAQFEEDFKEYVTLAGKEVDDSETEQTIKPTSPLIAAKNTLRPVEWRATDDAEWSKRSLGPHFLIRAIQAEHHKNLQTYDELKEDGYAYLYFFPEGYVEKAVLYIAPADEDDKSKWDQLTYTVVTRAWEGLAEVESGYREVDITRDEKSK